MQGKYAVLKTAKIPGYLTRCFVMTSLNCCFPTRVLFRSTKLASALTVAIANITYITFGILEYTNGIAKQEQLANQGIITSEAKGEAVTQLLSGVQANQSLGLPFVMTVVPCVLMFLSYILYKRFYKLDEEEYDRICGELEARTQDTI